MSIQAIAYLASHWRVKLCFGTQAERVAFSRYYLARCEQANALLGLSETIEHYRTTPYRELALEVQG